MPVGFSNRYGIVDEARAEEIGESMTTLTLIATLGLLLAIGVVTGQKKPVPVRVKVKSTRESE